MGQTWYLACDMQMFILSPLFIYPLWRWWKIGVSWTIFSILALQAGLVTIYIIWNVPATLFVTRYTIHLLIKTIFISFEMLADNIIQKRQ